MFNKKNKTVSKKGSKLYIGQKSYSNPYFKDVNKKSKVSFTHYFSFKLKIIIVILIALFFSFAWLLLYSKYFLIYDINTNIERVNNISRINKADVEKIAREELRSKFVFFPGNNYFLFNENKIFNRLDGDFAFEEIRVEKEFPNKLNIYLKEVGYALVWKELEKYYYITTEGDIINEVSPEEIKEIFPLINNKGRDLISGKKILDKNKHLELAVNLYKYFKDTNIFNIEEFTVGNQNDNTLTMKIFEGPEVYFNVNENVESQSDKLKLLRNEKLGDELYNKAYIDLRFGDMIYYR